jgi:hypothetical protein
MAETKTRPKRAKPKKAAVSKTATKTKSRSASKPKAKTRSTSKPKTRSRPSAKASSNSNPKGLVDKAKVPLMAGGAALAGAAGGIALGARQAHRKNGLPRISSKDLAKAARKAGDVGAQVGEIALEVRRARESNGNGRHRSPIEVVLQGLTSRGPRG